MLLKDKVALITGAASTQGIGFAAARLFIEHGARVAIVDTDPEKLRAAVARLNGAALGIAGDIRSADSCSNAVQKVLAQWGRLDVLLNNAGVVGSHRLGQITSEEYDAVLDVNLRGTLQMSQACIPHFTAGSSIVCIASIAAQRGGGLLGGAHYAASKGGILGFMKAAARELGPAGVRVNAINPGIITTPMNAQAFDSEAQEQLTKQIPLGRFGSPDHVAGACLFLASPLSEYITGASLDVNGGLHIH